VVATEDIQMKGISQDNLFWILFFFGSLVGLASIICSNIRKEREGYGEKETKETKNVLTEAEMAKITLVVHKALELEKGKAQVNVAQALDLINKLNKVLGGDLYKLIRGKSEQEIKKVKCH
jgi:hypothetical protein